MYLIPLIHTCGPQMVSSLVIGRLSSLVTMTTVSSYNNDYIMFSEQGVWQTFPTRSQGKSLSMAWLLSGRAGQFEWLAMVLVLSLVNFDPDLQKGRNCTVHSSDHSLLLARAPQAYLKDMWPWLSRSRACPEPKDLDHLIHGTLS